MKYITTVNEQQYIIEIDSNNQVRVNDNVYEIDFCQIAEGNLLSLLINNQSYEAVVDTHEDHYEVLMRGDLYTVEVQDEREYRLAKARGQHLAVTGEVTLKSPMPGLILKTPLTEGQQVTKGQTVIILESMKMENELKSPRDGVIKRLLVAVGTSVEKDQPLIVIGDPATDEDADLDDGE